MIQNTSKILMMILCTSIPWGISAESASVQRAPEGALSGSIPVENAQKASVAERYTLIQFMNDKELAASLSSEDRAKLAAMAKAYTATFKHVSGQLREEAFQEANKRLDAHQDAQRELLIAQAIQRGKEQASERAKERKEQRPSLKQEVMDRFNHVFSARGVAVVFMASRLIPSVGRLIVHGLRVLSSRRA